MATVRTNAQHPNTIVFVRSIAAGFVVSWDSSGDLSGNEETQAIAAAGMAVV
jgi:hypothetical protein